MSFLSSQMLVGKARSLPQSGGPERCFTQVGFTFPCKHQTRLEKLKKYKHYSLLQTLINYCSKKFHNIGLWADGLVPSLGQTLQLIVDTQITAVKSFLIVGFGQMGLCHFEVMDKHSSLICTFINYCCKRFYNIGLLGGWACVILR